MFHSSSCSNATQLCCSKNQSNHWKKQTKNPHIHSHAPVPEDGVSPATVTVQLVAHDFPLWRVLFIYFLSAAGFSAAADFRGNRPAAVKMSKEICKHEASPATGEASFHHPPHPHLNSPRLFEQTQELRDLSEVHHSQRKGNQVATRQPKPPHLLALQLKKAAEMQAFVSAGRGDFAHFWCRGKSTYGTWDKSECISCCFVFLFFFHWFIYTGKHQTETTANQEPRSSRSLWLTFLSHSQVHLQWLSSAWHDNIPIKNIWKMNRSSGAHPHRISDYSPHLSCHRCWFKLLLKSVMTGLLSELSLYEIMWFKKVSIQTVGQY